MMKTYYKPINAFLWKGYNTTELNNFLETYTNINHNDYFIRYEFKNGEFYHQWGAGDAENIYLFPHTDKQIEIKADRYLVYDGVNFSSELPEVVESSWLVKESAQINKTAEELLEKSKSSYFTPKDEYLSLDEVEKALI